MDKKPILEDEIKTVRDDPLNYGPAIVRQICEELLERRRAELRPPGDREAAEKIVNQIYDFALAHPQKLPIDVSALASEVAAALTAARAKEREKADAEIGKLIELREYYENKILDINGELGREDEWSNACDVGDECIEAAAYLVARVKELEGAAREAQEANSPVADAIYNDQAEPQLKDVIILVEKCDALAALLAKGAEEREEPDETEGEILCDGCGRVMNYEGEIHEILNDTADRFPELCGRGVFIPGGRAALEEEVEK